MKVTVAALLSFLVACASAPPATPRDAVSAFYTEYIHQRSPGLPEGPALERMRPMLSERLYGLIANALQYSSDYEKAHPGDKPPFVDGDAFTSNFEGADRFEIVSADGNEVTVKFHYETSGWNDVVVVKEERGRYVIDDVKFGGAGEFNPAGVLSESLQTREPLYDAELAKRLGADERGMKMYVLCILKTGPRDSEITGKEREDIFAGHFANIQRLADEGKLAVAGPFEKNDKSYRGLYIFNVPTLEDAEKLVVLDPAVKAGVFVPDLTLWYGSAAMMVVSETHKKLQKPE